MRGRSSVQPLPAPAEKARAVRRMFDSIAGRYDLLNRLMTGGMDMGWRRRSVRRLGLEPGSLVLDLACGTGDFCRILENEEHRAIGFDFAGQMLGRARAIPTRAGRRLRLAQADVLRLPVRAGAADGATCGFALRNVTDLAAFFAEVARVVRPGGRIALLEVAEPRSVVLRRGHRFYFTRVVPLIGGLLSDRTAYRYLPASVTYLPGPGEIVAMLRRAGFADARRDALSGGVAQVFVGTRG